MVEEARGTAEESFGVEQSDPDDDLQVPQNTERENDRNPILSNKN